MRVCVYIYKNRPGLNRVYPGRPGSGSTGFRRANSPAGFYLDPDRSQARVGQVPGRPAGPVRVSKLCVQELKNARISHTLKFKKFRSNNHQRVPKLRLHVFK